MKSDLPKLAAQIGAPERTLRRALTEGLVHANRPGPRQITIDADERAYLTSHWPLLAELRKALRTEPNVAMAVLFGSAARGEEHDDSDLDILISLRDPHVFRAVDLAGRLSRVVGRNVDVVQLAQAEAKPTLLADAVEHGRVLVDREGRFADLRSQRETLDRRAAVHRKQMSERARKILMSAAGR